MTRFHSANGAPVTFSARSMFIPFFLLLTACNTFAPKPDGGVGVGKPVYTELLDERRGELLLQEDGLWSFIAEDASKIAKPKPGTLFVYGDVESKARHFFALVSHQSWGYQLQRLDSDPLNAKDTGDLIPLTDVDRQVANRWDLCVDLECLQQSTDGIVWHIFETGSGRLSPPNLAMNSAMPFSRRAIWIADPVNDPEPTGTVPTSFVAIPGHLAPTRAKPVIATNCDVTLETESRATSNDAVPSHPLDIELNAAKSRADGLMHCEKSTVTFAVPALFRRELTDTFDGVRLGSLFGSRSHTLKNVAALSALAKYVAYAGAGDYATADFWLEQHLNSGTSYKQDVLVDLGDLPLQANRPEAAMRQIWHGTTQHWNRETNPRYSLIRARVEERLGDLKGATMRRADLFDVIEQARDVEFREYLQFFHSRSTLERAKEREVQHPTTDPTWDIAYKIEAVRQSVIQRQGVEDKTYDDLIELAAGVQPKPVDYLNSYTFPRGAPTPDDTLRIRPHYLSQFPIESWTSHVQTFEPDQRVAVATASIHVIANNERIKARNKVLEWLMAEPCNDSRKTPAANAETSRYARSARLQPDAAEGVIWLAEEIAPVKCDEIQLLEVVRAGETTDENKRVGMALILEQLDKKTQVSVTQVTELFSLALALKPNPPCQTLGLGAALAHLRVGDFDGASEMATKAASCSELPIPDQVTLAAYLHFEKTRALSSDYDKVTRRRIANVAHVIIDEPTECVATEPTSYDVTKLFTPELFAFSQKVTIKASPESVRLIYASDMIRDAEETLRDVESLMVTGTFEEVAKKVAFSHAQFDATQNVPGLRKTTFLQTRFFTATDKGKPPTAYLALQKKLVKKSNEKPVTFTEPETLALQFLSGEQATVDPKLYPNLCRGQTPKERRLEDIETFIK